MIRYALALILYLASTADAQISFTQHDPGITPHLTAYRDANPDKWWSWGLRLADIDGDGRLDIYVNTHHKNHGLYYRQGDALQFSLADTGHSPVNMPGGRPPIFGDFSGSGFLDIINTGSETVLETKIQDADGFHPASYLLRNDAAHELYEADGKLHAVSYTKAFGVTFLHDHVNLAPESYAFETIKTQVPIPTDIPQAAQDKLRSMENADVENVNSNNRYAGPMYWRGDLNGNGREDLVIQYGGSYGGGIYRFGMYFLRNEEGFLEDVTETCGIPSHLLPLLPPVDTANNGRLSILTAYGSIEQAGLYVQNEDGTFTLQRIGSTIAKTTTMGRATYAGTASYFYWPRWLDLDGDGDLDCVVSARRLGWIRVYENVDGVLLERHLIYHWDADGFDIGDVNGDGKPDIVVGHGLAGQSKQQGTSVTVWLNTTPAPPIDPEDPECPEDPPPPDPEDPLPLVTRLTINGVESLEPVEVLLNGLSVGVAGDELDVLIGTAPVDPEVPEDPPIDTEDPQVITVTPDTINLVESASEGQSFLLREGTYRPFYIRGRHGLTIRGEPGAIISGRGTEIGKHAVIIRECHGVTIDGLTCTKGNAGIGAYASHNLTIRNCTLVGNDTWGVFTSVCDDTVIQDNVFTDNFSEADPSRGQHGIYISNSSQRPVIERNTSTGHKRAGIQINGDRFSSGKRDGITHGAIVRDNVLTNNKIGLNLDGCSDSLFEGNQVDDGMRFFKIDGGEASSRNVIRNNRIFEKREQSAVLILDGSKDNVFEHNIIEIPMTHPSWAHAIAVEEGDRGSSMISRFNTFIVPGAPFGGGQFGKDSRSLEEMNDEGSTVERK